MKDEIFLIPVKLYPCLVSLCGLVGGLYGRRGRSLPAFSRDLLKPRSWFVKSHLYPHGASFRQGKDLPRLLLPGVDS